MMKKIAGTATDIQQIVAKAVVGYQPSLAAQHEGADQVVSLVDQTFPGVGM